MHDLTARVIEDELMDQPGLDGFVHRHALSGLGRVNWWSGTSSYLWQALERLAQRRGLQHVRILDLACGGGDVSLDLARRAAQSQLSVTVHGWDRSPTAVQVAESRADRQRLSDTRFFVRDAVVDPIEEPYDLLISTLFLHHLETAEIAPFLQKMTSAAQHAVFVDDLRRTRWGYSLAWLGTRILTRSSIVHIDGPASVHAALSVAEIEGLAQSAGLGMATIRCHWPQRFLLTWERP